MIFEITFIVVMIHIAINFVKFVKYTNNVFQISLLAMLISILSLVRILGCAVSMINLHMSLLILISISFGERYGLIVGCLFCFISNFFLGQGVWTLYQIISYGYVGLISGKAFKTKKEISGLQIFLFNFLVYILSSLITNISSFFFFFTDYSIEKFLCYYFYSLLIDVPCAVFSGLFLILCSKKIFKVFLRIKKVYLFKL